MNWLKGLFRKRESGVPKHRNPPPPPGSTEATIAAATALYSLANQLMLTVLPKMDLENQLKNALEREDYETAARLRDLINKK